MYKTYTRRNFTPINRVDQATVALHKRRSGFTLIELLVVVLIIGILAAVAVPQYRLAVNKSHFAKFKALAKSYVQAAQIYYVNEGVWPNSFKVLDVDLPGGMTLTPESMAWTCGQNDEMYCCIRGAEASVSLVTCGENTYSFAFTENITGAGAGEYCVANPQDNTAVKLCQSLSNVKISTYAPKWALFTPTGTKGSYSYYMLK